MQPITIQFAVRVGLYLYLILSASWRHYLPGRIKESTTGYTFTPFVRYFTSEWLIIAHGKKGPTAFSVSVRKTLAKWGKGNCKSCKQPQWDSNPWALDCQSRALRLGVHTNDFARFTVAVRVFTHRLRKTIRWLLIVEKSTYSFP